ncbi:MAG: hypothetical protein J7K21_05205 [Desulfurococcales archaeon]|nr:hypothetical protein [Desulfurococcales archaeon]
MIPSTIESIIALALYILIFPMLYLVFRARDRNVKTGLYIVSYILLAFSTILFYITRYIDSLSFIMGLSFTLLSLPITLYSIDYKDKKGITINLDLMICLFSILLISAFISPSLILLAISWTLAEILGFTIIFYGETAGHRASKRFLFISTMTFEITVFTLIYLSILSLATTIIIEKGLFEALFTPYWILEQLRPAIPSYLLPLVLIGFITKSALVPLHFWLPDAHTVAPSPGSALLSGVMTGLGLYGLYRVYQIIRLDPIIFFYVLAVLGIISIVYGGLQSLIQHDIKRMLAYSTIMGTGLSAVMLAVYVVSGEPIAYTVFILAILSHAGYKASLFLNAGTMELVYHTRKIELIRGFSKLFPISSLAAYISIFSLIGIPPTAGFTAKLLGFIASLELGLNTIEQIFPLIGLVLTIALSVAIGLRYMHMFFDKPSIRTNIEAREYNEIEFMELIAAGANIYMVFPLICSGGVNIPVLIALLLSLPLLIIMIYTLYLIAGRGVGGVT